MKKVIILSFAVLLFFMNEGCQDIYLTHSTLKKTEIQQQECKELKDFVAQNMFYIKSDNSYLLARGFQSILATSYDKCIENLTLSEIKQLFGYPTCETNNQLCYHLYLYRPVSSQELRVAENLALVFTTIGNKVKRGGKCNCNKE